ncbi:L,D-transpeptidase family protein [Fibrella sp. WM1]|uniref:L,D-transpeptidase family protein n=1 Tax=Fibrella musci TaxID=3242485 RepID=UPI003522159D
MTQRRNWIQLGRLGTLLLALTFIRCSDKKPTGPNWPAQLQATRRYADSLGIDSTRFANSNPAEARQTLEKLITEIRYGHEPDDQSFAKLTETVDTAVVGKALRAGNVAAALKTEGPRFAPYKALLAQYQQARQTATPEQRKAIERTLNYYRYLSRFSNEQFILVNIPAARLVVYNQAGQRTLPMDVIVGKADKATPRFNCNLTEIVAYPYWNVPESIAKKEILPKVKASASYLDSQNMQILDARNEPVDPESIDWENVSASDFPYRFRQTSGCHNSLGLIKFVLNGPPAIYLHDTNARELFDQTTNHWRSHGCVRVQQPVELANFVLGATKFDEGFYNRCLVDQTPKSFKLPKPFPVFVTYLLADVDDQGKLVYYKDVYRLEKKMDLAAR